MIVDDKGRLFRKINLIDLLIILIVIAAVVFFWGKFGKAKIITSFDKQVPVAITFVVESMPEYSVDAIKVGDVTVDKISTKAIGKVAKVEKGPDISYAPDQDGNYVQSSKPGYCSAEITVEGSGVFNEYGVVNMGNTEYYINRSDAGLYVGDVMIYSKIKSIEKK